MDEVWIKIKDFAETHKEKLTMLGASILAYILAGFATGWVSVALTISSLIFALSQLPDEQINKLIEMGIQILDSIFQGIYNNKEKVSLALMNILSAIGTWVGEHSVELAKLGLLIAGAIIAGLAEGLFNVGGKMGEKILGNVNQNSGMTFGERWNTGAPESLQVGNRGGGGGQVTVVQTNNVQVADLRQFSTELNKRSQEQINTYRQLGFNI